MEGRVPWQVGVVVPAIGGATGERGVGGRASAGCFCRDTLGPSSGWIGAGRVPIAATWSLTSSAPMNAQETIVSVRDVTIIAYMGEEIWRVE